MGNFKQICKVKTDFTSKQPEMEVKQSDRGPSLIGKLTWLDGKKPDGKPDFTWFNFRTSKEEFMNTFLENQTATFEVEGFLKNRHWQGSDGVWRSRQEILISKVSLYTAEKAVAHFQERVEEEIEPVKKFNARQFVDKAKAEQVSSDFESEEESIPF